MATIQKRKNKNGTHSFRVMVRQSDGYPPASKTFPTRQEAKDWAQQEEFQRRQGSYIPSQAQKQHTFNELVNRYLTIVLPTKPKNAKTTKRHLTWWMSKLGKYQVRLITPELIARCRQELAEGLTPKRTKRSPATVNRYLAALSVVMSYAVRECGWLTDNPCSRVSRFTESIGRDRIASQEECLHLLEACKNSRNEYLLPIVLIAITTGMRQGEILGLTWECIDLERGIITLKETKNGRPRIVSLVGDALNVMRERSLLGSSRSNFVFPSKKRFGKTCIRGSWNTALQRAKIVGLRFHDLRHTFTTYAAESGASNLELAAATGHLCMQMLQRYTHLKTSTTQKLSLAVHNKIFEKDDGKNEASKAS